VRLHREVEGLLGPGRREAQPDQGAARLAGDEVRALDGQPGPRRDRLLDVAVAAREALGRREPGAVDGEPDAVEQLDRRREDAAHLAARIEAGGGMAARLGTDLVGPRAGGDEPPGVEAIGGGQLVGRERD